MPHLDWTGDTDGQHTAAITFSADGAISLRIAVQATLPSGASVQVFDGEGQPRGSAFTQADFNASGNAPVWLPSAEGDTLTVQITLPSAEDVEVLSFTVTSVAHRFASIVPRLILNPWTRVIVTDRLRSYGAAMKDMGVEDLQLCGQWRNNRAENSHQPFRRREGAMARRIFS